MTKPYYDDLIHRLYKRAEIRRNISTRKSVQNNEPDRISDLLEEAARALGESEIYSSTLESELNYMKGTCN